MISLAVINRKDLIKYFFKFLIMIIICFLVVKIVSKIDSRVNIKTEKIAFEKYLEITIPSVKEISKTKVDEEQREYIFKESLMQKVLSLEFKMIDTISKVEDTDNEVAKQQENVKLEESDNNGEVAQNEEKKQEELQLAEAGLKTEVVQSGITPKVTNNYKGVEIKNETAIPITEEMLSGEINIDKRDIVIFHTHTSESYTPSEKYYYETTGTYRTTDLNYSVARVGKELTEYLKKYEYNVIHDTTCHDYPAYSGSYSRSLVTVKNLIKQNTQMVLDIHRDAVGSMPNYAPTVKIGEESAAQLMFVMGTNGGGSEHTNWRENLKFVIALQAKANELYPGLFKPIILRNSRYNQQVSTEAAIIEVGATGNTMEQCLTSMKYLAKVIDEL